MVLDIVLYAQGGSWVAAPGEIVTPWTRVTVKNTGQVK